MNPFSYKSMLLHVVARLRDLLQHLPVTDIHVFMSAAMVSRDTVSRDTDVNIHLRMITGDLGYEVIQVVCLVYRGLELKPSKVSESHSRARGFLSLALS